MEKKDVFISYRATEANEAYWVKSVLEMYGISCWIAPNCISGGSDYAHEIPNAINNSKIFVLMLSRKAQNSQWVKKELSTAIKYEKIVMPFMIENFNLNKEFNFFLSNVQRYEAYVNKTQMIYNMVNEINRILGKDEITPPEDESKLPKPEPKEEENERNSLSTALISLTPYGRKHASDPKVRFSLNVMTILILTVFVPLLLTSIDQDGLSAFTVGLFLVGFLCWYIGYAVCIAIGKIKKWNKIIASLSTFAVFNIIIISIAICAVSLLSRFIW